MRLNEEIELSIERMSFGPAAVGRYQTPDNPRPMVVFVSGALPGENVRARLKKSHKSYWEAELVEVLTASPDRAQPPCPVFDRCGGCQWQHLRYPAQVKAKAEILVHQLQRSTRLPEEELRAKLETHAARSELGYRARLQVHGDGKGLGFFAAGSHAIVRTDLCVVAHPDIQTAWTTFAGTRPLAELAKKTGQFKVEWTRTESGQVLEAINRKHGAYGFTQVNPEQNEVLVDVVTKLAGTGGLLFDLYGGDGNLSNKLTGAYRHVLSVDTFNEGSDPLELKGPFEPGRVFVRESAEDFLLNQRWRDWGLEKIDCVIADPPRSGMAEGAKRLAALNVSRLVLVSCEPSTLARDLMAFVGSYRIERIHLIDMFPQTYHMETVVLLTRKD